MTLLSNMTTISTPLSELLVVVCGVSAEGVDYQLLLVGPVSRLLKVLIPLAFPCLGHTYLKSCCLDFFPTI